MASDLSSSTEVNGILDDEKEEGELSLEDVSSSEELPTFNYQPKVFGQCPHCRSTGQCATWCTTLTLNKKIFIRASQREPFGKVQPCARAEVTYVVAEDAGKENRRHHHHHYHHQRAPPAGLPIEDLQPISSDDDLELVGLTKKKKSHKKKRRRKSPSLSLSPLSDDHLTSSIKESIHRVPTRRHESPVKRKSEQQRKSPLARKPSPQRMKKLKKPIGGETPLQSRGTVTKLLKRVKKLEPYSTRSKDKRTSLKDKLSNIIGGKKSDEEEIMVVELKTKEKSPEIEKKEIVKAKESEVQPAVSEEKKQQQKESVVVGENIKKEADEDIEVLREIALSTKQDKQVIVKTEPTEEQQPTPPPAKKEERRQPDEDLQLRLIALRSAVIKKHLSRRAKKNQLQKQQQQQQESSSSSEPVPRIESPFTSSFNQDFPLLAEICNPGSPTNPQNDDIYCPEDMELDSDMELENEISMAFNNAQEELNKIINGDSPYSPTDELISPNRLTPTKELPVDHSLYTLSRPTETPMIVPSNVKKNGPLNGSTLESRPYSPSDDTVYDPELPGVLRASNNQPPSLQPPPLPPTLGMMPMMPINSMNLLGTFPIMPMGGFAPVNPMLPAPFIPFTTTPAPTTNNVTTKLLEEFGETDLDGSPLVPIEPKDTNWKFIGEPLYLPEINKLPTSVMLPSGGLVPSPVLKSNKQLQKTITKKPSESLFKNADMRPVAIEEESKIGGTTFKPIKLPAPVKKSVTLQSAAAFSASVDDTIDSQNPVWSELEQDLRELEEVGEEESKRRHELEEKKRKEAEERKKQEQREAEELEKRKKQEREAEEKRRQERDESEKRRNRERDEVERRRRQPIRRLRSITPAPRARRRSMRTPSRAREIDSRKSPRSSRESVSRSTKSKGTENSSDRSDKQNRRPSIDEDEEALRQSLLASLAKRKSNVTKKALEASKATSDKENIVEKSQQVVTLPEANTFEKPNVPTTLLNVQNIAANDVRSGVFSSNLNPMPVVTVPNVEQQPTLKRPAALLTSEQPLRKVVKRLTTVFPTSTRVNHAKRYQIMLNQRKITQQKFALYKTRFAVKRGERQQLSSRPQPSKLSMDRRRFVISLNKDSDSDPESDEKKKKSAVESRTKPESDEKKKKSAVMPRPLLAIRTDDFEKSVDQFLKIVRLQQEHSTTTTTTAVSKVVTRPLVAKTISSAASKTVTSTGTVPTAALAPASKAASANAYSSVIRFKTVASPKVVKATATTKTPKGRTVLNIPKPKTTTSTLSIVSATPQALKHLPASQQEEYRRLKKQIYEYEQLRLQKSKESATTTGTTSQAQAQTTIVKSVNISSSLNTPSTSPIVLATSTPKASIAKPLPKTQLIASVNPMSKPSTVPPIIATPTKIVHCTTNVTTKTIAPSTKPISKTVTITSNSKPAVSSVAKLSQSNPNHLNLLSKITESLNSQKTQLNAAASKITSLRVLTKEQINQKTSDIQLKNHHVVMDDLNTVGGCNGIRENKNDIKEVVEAKKINGVNVQDNKVAKSVVVKKSIEVSRTEKSQDEDKSMQAWDKFKQRVEEELQQSLTNLPFNDQKNLLVETEEELISKRHAVMDDIMEMSGNLRQWEIERDLQNSIICEVQSLREQLRIAEEKLQLQKEKLQTIQPKVTLYHQKINTGRKECFRLSQICNCLGHQVVGSNYKVPTAGAELLNNKIKEVAAHSQKLRGKKTSVQSNKSVKTIRTRNVNNKISVKPNSNVKQVKIIVNSENEKSESISKNSHAKTDGISDKGASSRTSNVDRTPNANNIFNMQSNNQPMDNDNENLSINNSVADSVDDSSKETKSTNSNVEQIQNVENKCVSVKIEESHLSSAEPITDNDRTLNMETDNQRECDTNVISNNKMSTNVESECTATDNNKDSETSYIEAMETSDSHITNAANGDSEALIEAIDKPQRNDNGIANNLETLNMDIVEQPDCNSTDEIVNGTVTSRTDTVKETECNDSYEVIDSYNTEESTITIVEETESNTESETLKNSLKVLNVDGVNNSPNECEKCVLDNEKLPSSQRGQSADITINFFHSDNQKPSKESDVTVQNSGDTATKKVSEKTVTSNLVLDTAFADKAQNVETEIFNLAMNVDEPQTNEQSPNSGPTIVIADNVKSDSVINNKNTNSAVNTACSLDNFMEEMTVDNEDNEDMCSKNCKSSASIASTDTQHSTTFEEEIRLLELASKSDVPQEFPIVDKYRYFAKIRPHMTDKVLEQSQMKDAAKRKTFQPYESVLKTLHVLRNKKIDGILCPFQLRTGTCYDEDCQFVHHQSASQ